MWAPAKHALHMIQAFQPKTVSIQENKKNVLLKKKDLPMACRTPPVKKAQKQEGVPRCILSLIPYIECGI